MLNLGIAYATSGDVSDAAKTWNELLVLDPSNQDAQKYLQTIRKMGRK